MRGWRNWQTRMLEVHVGNLEGSNPFSRTKKTQLRLCFFASQKIPVEIFCAFRYTLGEQIDSKVVFLYNI